MKTAKIVFTIAAIMVVALSCSTGTGSDPAYAAGTPASGSSAEQNFRADLASALGSLPSDPSPEAVFLAGTATADSMNANSIGVANATAIIEGEVSNPTLRGYLLLVVADGYSLQELQSQMTGIASDPEQQITAALSLDENIDEDSVAQLSGDAEWVPGISGSGIRFDAEGEYVTVPDDPSLDLTGAEAAIELWLYPENNFTAAGLVHKGIESDFSDESYSLQYNQPGQVAMIFTNESGKHTYVISNEERLALNEWHHVVVTWNMSDVWMYVDGDEVTNLQYYQNGWKSSLPADFAPIKETNGDLLIGSQPVPGYRFEGIIDNVVLYDRIVTAEEVTTTYQLYTN